MANTANYDVNTIPKDAAGINEREKAMLHVLDLGANYWSLWTESENLERYHEQYPRGFSTLQQRMGYRVRPSWVWQRKRDGASEVIVCVANDGVSGVPGVLRLSLESRDGKFRMTGGLDAGHPFGGRIREASFVVPREIAAAAVQTARGDRSPGSAPPGAMDLRTADSTPMGRLRSSCSRTTLPGWRKGV